MVCIWLASNWQRGNSSISDMPCLTSPRAHALAHTHTQVFMVSPYNRDFWYLYTAHTYRICFVSNEKKKLALCVWESEMAKGRPTDRQEGERESDWREMHDDENHCLLNKLPKWCANRSNQFWLSKYYRRCRSIFKRTSPEHRKRASEKVCQCMKITNSIIKSQNQFNSNQIDQGNDGPYHPSRLCKSLIMSKFSATFWRMCLRAVLQLWWIQLDPL